MDPLKNYKEVNRDSWNKRAEIHYDSDFYDNKNFIKGKSSLKKIELELLGDITDRSLLHLQCHFGQDTISLNRLGARTTGVDLSDKAIEKANQLAQITNSNARFIQSDLYELPKHLDEVFDIVFTSYGTIGWLPDLGRWAAIVSKYLRKGGLFIMADFHPVVWMLDDDFTHIKHNYANEKAIIEQDINTYAERNQKLNFTSVSWNHSISEILNSLIVNGLRIEVFNEFDYSPYNCFAKTIEFKPGKFRIKHLGNKIPMVYAIKATKE